MKLIVDKIDDYNCPFKTHDDCLLIAEPCFVRDYDKDGNYECEACMTYEKFMTMRGNHEKKIY